MDYEKLYKEALERASKYYNANTNKGYREIFEDIFHEFKESEDERIRKEIIQSIKDNMCVIHKNKCLAWLEKQDEQKAADSYCQENCKGFQETGKCFTDGECKAKREAGQKYTWSEEDENGLGDALWAIQQARTIAKDENDMGNLWYAENWLKSIKGRVQPKQELNKDDESCISNLESLLYYDKSLPEDTRTKLGDFLNSLKPQQNQYDKGYNDGYSAAKYNHWKPSEEQMEALIRCLYEDIHQDKELYIKIESLYNDLKNL